MLIVTCNVGTVYAVVFDWHKGKSDPIYFKASTYLDVYNSYINTILGMHANCPNKCHAMMADIYAKVKCVLNYFDNS